MSKLSCILLMSVLCSLSTADPDDIYHSKENVLQVEGFGNEEVKESNLNTKCYDEETKSVYKVDSVWYPEGKCEKRTCSRTKDSKTPFIKTMECEPCICNSLGNVCHPFRAEKNYPKCCLKCLPKSVILQKSYSTKKYKNT